MTYILLNRRFLFRGACPPRSALRAGPVPPPFSISTRVCKKFFPAAGGNSCILTDTQDVGAAFSLLSDQDFSQGNIMKST